MIGARNLVGLVNNAGIVVSGPLLYLRPSEYRRQLDVNMISPLVVIQAFAPLLGTDKKRQGPAGRIVNISSSGAKVAIPLLGAYSASKFGLEGMSDALRRELMLFGIDVVIIEPGTVNTAMYDKGEKEDLSEFKPTEYWEAVQKFQKFIVTEARTNGLSPERLGEAVHVALSTAKPKARYSVIPQRSRTGLFPDFFLQGWSTPSSQRCSDSQSRSQRQVMSPRRHLKRRSTHPNFREKDLTFALANDRRSSNSSE
jgi:NAD(P)-dependent dehydrogenase (short-subunit alcohol dehydrogenase family)